MSNISFTGAFDKYVPINQEPYYRFITSTDAYLIKCEDYPKFISKISPNDLVKISGDVGSRVSEGLKLVNVKFNNKERGENVKNIQI